MTVSRLFLIGISVGILLAVCAALAFAQAAEPTQADKLQLELVLLRGQLAEALKAQAKCEADGSKASQQLQQAQTEGQALIKALDARGLMVDPQTNTIVAKPKEKTP